MNTDDPQRVGDMSYIARAVEQATATGEANGLGNCRKEHAAPHVAEHYAREHCDRHPTATYRDRDPWLSGCEVCRAESFEEARRDALQRHAETVAAQCDKRFPPRYRDAVADHAGVLEWVREYQQNPKTARSLLILGPTGVGKTYQAYGALRAAAVGYAAAWMAGTSADLVAALRPRSGVDTEATMEKYRTTDLLMVDDLGIAKQSEWVEEAMYRLIGGRYDQMRPTIYTSNLAVKQLRDALGDRIASRLSETCISVLLDGPDRRRLP